MAIVKTTGTTDTPISGVTALTLDRGLINFGADYRVKSDNPGKEAILTNITTPLDLEETFRLSYQEVKDIYAKTSIDTALRTPAKSGINVLVGLNQIVQITESTDPTFNLQLPVSYHLVIKMPKSGYLTSTDILTGLGRLMSGLFATGSEETSRLDAILRGSLVPTDL